MITGIDAVSEQMCGVAYRKNDTKQRESTERWDVFLMMVSMRLRSQRTQVNIDDWMATVDGMVLLEVRRPHSSVS